MDKSAPDGEHWMIVITLESIAAVAAVKGNQCNKTAYVFTDSLSSMQLLQGSLPQFRYRQWQLTQEAKLAAATQHVVLDVRWVPSHGKPWKRRMPPAEVGVDRAKWLNSLADEECTRLLDEFHGGKQNRAKKRAGDPQVQEAEDWTARTLSYAEEVWRMYSLWLRQQSGGTVAKLQEACHTEDHHSDEFNDSEEDVFGHREDAL